MAMANKLIIKQIKMFFLIIWCSSGLQMASTNYIHHYINLILLGQFTQSGSILILNRIVPS